MGFGLKKAWNKLRARKLGKKLRKAVGLTAQNKWARSIKKSLRSFKSSYSPYSVSSLGASPTNAVQYYHQARSLSQLMGGN